MSRPMLRVVVAILWVAVLGSSLGVVYGKQQARNRFSELQKLVNQRDDLDIAWGQLQLEQSTWATHARVEQVARDDLGMDTPPPGELHMVHP